jgi:hypothetical protein
VRRNPLLVLLAAFLVGGCGPTNPHEAKRSPVRGSLYAADGKPAVGATVTLHPTDGSKPDPLPFAVVGADGAFVIGGKSAGDGAPLGTYAVTVVWRSVVPAETPEDKLNGRYSNPSKPLSTVTVQDRDTDLGPLKIK